MLWWLWLWLQVIVFLTSSREEKGWRSWARSSTLCSSSCGGTWRVHKTRRHCSWCPCLHRNVPSRFYDVLEVSSTISGHFVISNLFNVMFVYFEFLFVFCNEMYKKNKKKRKIEEKKRKEKINNKKKVVCVFVFYLFMLLNYKNKQGQKELFV